MGRRFFTPASLIFIAAWLLLMVAGRQALFRDPGTFWHVVVGREILQTGQLPREDHFSFTREGHPWVADQWLAEIVMALVHRAAGWDGLLTLAAALLAALFSFLAARLMHAGLHWLPALMLLALVALASSHQFHVRPLIVTLLGTAVMYAGLIDLEAGRRGGYLAVGLLVLSWFWANLHGGVLGGIGMTLIALIGWTGLRLIRIIRKGKKGSEKKETSTYFQSPIPNPQSLALQPSSLIPHPDLPPSAFRLQLAGGWLLLGLGLLLLFANPYGTALPASWIETLRMPLPELIQEHRRAAWNDPSSLAVGVLGILYLAAFFGLSPHRWRATWLIPSAWLVLGMLRVRNVPLFAITAALALVEMLPQSRWAGLLQRRGMFMNFDSNDRLAAAVPAAAKRNFLKPFLFPAVLLLVVFGFQALEVPLPMVSRGWVRFDPRIAPEELLEEIETIARDAPPGGERIFNELNFGGFLIYEAPRLKIFIDDRCPLYGSDFLRAYDRARRYAPEEIEHWRQEYGFRYALVEAEGRFDRYLARCGRWTALGRTATAALYRCDLGKTPKKQ
jgi:hypothetical protein